MGLVERLTGFYRSLSSGSKNSGNSGYSLDGALARAAHEASSSGSHPSATKGRGLSGSGSKSSGSGVVYDSRADTVKVIDTGSDTSGSSNERYTRKLKAEPDWSTPSDKFTRKLAAEPDATQSGSSKSSKSVQPTSYYDIDRSKAAKEVQKFAKTPEQVFESARETIEERALEAHAKGLTETNIVERLTIGTELATLGIAAGALGVAQGMYEVGKTATKGDVLGAGEQLVKGTAEWFISIPKKVEYAFTDSPYFAGQLVGEIVAGEFVGRGAVKAGRSVTVVAEPASAALFKAQLKTKVYGSILADNIAIRAAPYKMKLQEIGLSITEPLYQKGILKPKTEVVTEKPVSQVLKEAAETYRNIEEGAPGLKGDIRPLSRADIKLIESKVAKEKITPDYLKEAAETYKNIEEGISSSQQPLFTIRKSEVAELLLREKPKEYWESARILAEELGFKELIEQERKLKWKFTDIIDISETGETAKIATIYKGKRAFKVQREVRAEDIPEQVWERLEEINDSVERAAKLKTLKRGEQSIIKLQEKWEKREKELAKKFKKRRSSSRGQSALLLEPVQLEEQVKNIKTRRESRVIVAGLSDIVSEELMVKSLENPSQKFKTLLESGGVIEKQIERMVEGIDLKLGEDVGEATGLIAESISIIDQVQGLEPLQQMTEDLEQIQDQMEMWSDRPPKRKNLMVFSFIDEIKDMWSEEYGYMELRHKFPTVEEMLFGSKSGKNILL